MANACKECGTTSEERALLHCEIKGEEEWVCVGCLPRLIHGAHQSLMSVMVIEEWVRSLLREGHVQEVCKAAPRTFPFKKPPSSSVVTIRGVNNIQNLWFSGKIINNGIRYILPGGRTMYENRTRKLQCLLASVLRHYSETFPVWQRYND